MARICPDCTIPLIRKDFRGITLDVCQKCAGIFFDEGEVNQVRKQAATALEELDALIQPESFDPGHPSKIEVKCPDCRTVMSEYRYLYASPIFLNSCDKCAGIWVQNGELQRMAEYLRGDHTNDPVVAQMNSTSQADIARAKRLERSMRIMSRQVH